MSKHSASPRKQTAILSNDLKDRADAFKQGLDAVQNHNKVLYAFLQNVYDLCRLIVQQGMELDEFEKLVSDIFDDLPQRKPKEDDVLGAARYVLALVYPELNAKTRSKYAQAIKRALKETKEEVFSFEEYVEHHGGLNNVVAGLPPVEKKRASGKKLKPSAFSKHTNNIRSKVKPKIEGSLIASFAPREKLAPQRGGGFGGKAHRKKVHRAWPSQQRKTFGMGFGQRRH